MGENEQGGMLRSVVVIGLIAIISFVVVSGIVAIAGTSKSSQHDTVSKITDAVDNIDDSSISNYQYTYNAGNLTATIYGVANKDSVQGKDVQIPAKVKHDGKTYTIIGLGSSVFADMDVTSVIIPDTVTSLGSWLFKNDKLTSVIIPSSVTTLEDGVFFNNKLTSVSLPANLTKIGNSTFQQNQLNSINLNNKLESIGDGAFNQNNISSLDLPDSLKSVGKWAFSQNKLTNGSVKGGKNLEFFDASAANASFDVYWDGTGNKAIEPVSN